MNTLRWIGVVPAALIGSVLFGFGAFLLTYPITWLGFLGEWVGLAHWLLLTAVVAFASPLWFICWGTAMAPYRKTQTTYCLAALFTVVILSSPFLEGIMDYPLEQQTRWWQLPLGLLGVVYAVRIAQNSRSQEKSSSEEVHPDASNGEDAYEFAYKVLVSYSEILQNYQLYRIVDESRLPHNKKLIKTSLELLISAQAVDEEALESIELAYCMLSKFQPNASKEETMQRWAFEACDISAKNHGDSHTEEERLIGMIQARNRVLNKELCKTVDEEGVKLQSNLHRLRS